jgi:hypothetical protein
MKENRPVKWGATSDGKFLCGVCPVLVWDNEGKKKIKCGDLLIARPTDGTCPCLSCGTHHVVPGLEEE